MLGKIVYNKNVGTSVKYFSFLFIQVGWNHNSEEVKGLITEEVYC